jgi:hypothetical protein
VGHTAPLEAFLFDKKRGHCEYFSSAMTIMLRTLGIRARNVTGYVGGRYNGYGDYYAVRQGDAHSWVEAYIPERGWVTFDPTPPSRAEIGPSEGAWADIRALIDALHTRWITNVVGYDLRVQATGVRKMWQWWMTQRNARREAESVAGEVGARWLPTRATARWFVAFAVLIALGWIALRLRSRNAPAARKTPEHVAQALRLYAELERTLRKRGRARPPAATPFEHARQLSEDGFAASSDVEAITRGYVESRYGERVLSAHEIAELRAGLDRIRAAAP